MAHFVLLEETKRLSSEMNIKYMIKNNIIISTINKRVSLDLEYFKRNVKNKNIGWAAK